MTTPDYPTGLGLSTETEISLMGLDLAGELIGKVSFGELALWMIHQRRPTSGEVRLFEAVLVALADHGFTPTAIVSRLTLLSAPDSIQGALAAGLLGGGSRFLGVTEDTGRFLVKALSHGMPEDLHDTEGWNALALTAIRQARDAGQYVPGLGHPVHKISDPRTQALMDLAQLENVDGPHLALFAAIGRVHPQVLSKRLPLNGAGVCGAVLCDLHIPTEILRGVSILARCAGLLGQLAEEIRNPVGSKIYLEVEEHARFQRSQTPPPPR
jgi:citrate synthase